MSEQPAESTEPTEPTEPTESTEPTEPTATESVELDVDEEKVEAWDEVKADYQVEPGGEPVPNAMDDAGASGAKADHADTGDEEG
jgi:hypothetical protein